MREVIIADVKSVNKDNASPGHYFTVAHNYENLFLNAGYKIEVAGGPIYGIEFKDYVKLKYDTYIGKSNIKNKYHVLMNIKNLFHKVKNTIIIFQSNAVATAYLGIALFAKKNNPVYMIQYNTMGLDNPVKRLLYRWAFSKIKGMICTSDSIGQAYNKPYCVVPDYIYTGKPLQTSNYNCKYDFCIVGLIGRDKGVLEAVRFFAESNYTLHVAGKVTDNMLQNEIIDVAKNCKNIKLEFGYLSNERYCSIIKNSKYCLLNYSNAYNTHSSGVVYDILFNGTPIIARRCKFLEFIGQWNIGLLYEDISKFDFESALNDKVLNSVRNNINNYLDSHSEAAKSLIKFVIDESN